MGLFDFLFGRAPRRGDASRAWQTLTAYTPTFTSWDGKTYESELCRASIDALARNSAKLQPVLTGAAQPKLRSHLSAAPNPFMTWYQYLYRTRTILENQNNVFIVPVYDSEGREIEGFFPVLPSRCELRELDGMPWLRYTFLGGMQAALPMDEVGILTRHQYTDDFFGDSNSALQATLEMIHMQQQGVTEGIKNGATFRFMARVSNFTKPEDLAKERKRFNEQNLRGESGGILLFPNTYADIKQIEQKPFALDADQVKQIQTNVYNYYGTNEDIIQNRCYGDAYSAFYEGAIEPFAIQCSEVHSAMVFTARERRLNNSLFFTSNRIQFMSNADKLQVSAQLVDRGIFSRNDARAIWNLPPIEGGDRYVIRGEYKNAEETAKQEDPSHAV